MRKILPKKFFLHDTEKVAKELLGKFLVRRLKNIEISKMITEVEVYDSLEDLASHASKKRSTRNEILFKDGGIWYVYFVYGIHNMLNIVTREKEYPAGILIRGLKGIKGPGRLTKAFSVDRTFNGKPANKNSGLWIEDRGIKINSKEIKTSPRIGVEFAGKFWASKHWRFYID